MRTLKVTPVKQLPKHCGPASVEVILAYYGISISQEKIAEKMVGFDPAHGVSFSHLGIFLEQHGFKTLLQKDSTQLRGRLRNKELSDKRHIIRWCNRKVKDPKGFLMRKHYKEYVNAGGQFLIKPISLVPLIRKAIENSTPPLLVTYNHQGTIGGGHVITAIGIDDTRIVVHNSLEGEIQEHPLESLNILMCLFIEPKTSY